MKSRISFMFYFLLGAAILMAGCSFSYSSGKSSDSSKSSSASSGSSDNKSEKAAYIRDITNLTVAAVKENHPAETYLREIGRIAKSHGITDWEREKSTFTAIGKGLKAAVISDEDLPDSTILNIIAGSRKTARNYVIEGYNS